MNQNKNHSSNIGLNKLVDLFFVQPEQALEQLLETRMYLYPIKRAQTFWEKYQKLDVDKFVSEHQDLFTVFDKIGRLHLLYQHFQRYTKEIEEYEALIKQLKPTTEALVSALFLSLELGDLFDHPMPRYSPKSLTAVKKILKKQKEEAWECVNSYTIELLNHSKHYLMLEVDLSTLWKFINAFERGGLFLDKIEGRTGYKLSIPEWQPKSENLYLLNFLKNEVKHNYKRQESQAQISELEHFKKHDQIFNTNQGLPAVFYSGCEMISQPDGIAAVKVHDTFGEKLTSPDPEVRTQGQVEMLEMMFKANYHYQLREALAGIYYPNDIIDINAQKIVLSKHCTVSLYELFAAISCLSALADNLRYVSELPNSGSLAQTKGAIAHNIKALNPHFSDSEANAAALHYIATNWGQIEKVRTPFYILKKEVILKYFKDVEELKGKKDADLEVILDTISSLENDIAFNPLYKLGDDYFFSFKTCGLSNLNRAIYDNFVSGRLFRLQGKIDESADVDHTTREAAFCKAIAEALSSVATKAKANLDYAHAKGYNFNGLEGQIDDLGYFQEENLIIAIQVKLSNTTIRNEKRKNEWVRERLYDEASRQVCRDAELLSTEEGLRFVSDELGLGYTITNPTVFHLIVTDNFYADHEAIPFGNDESVLCISYFELYNLISNARVDPAQDNWESVIEKQSGEYLVSLILDNVFWSFLKEKAEGYNVSEDLKLAIKANNITLTL